MGAFVARRLAAMVPLLLLIMFLLMVVSAAIIYAAMRNKTSVEATMKYEIGPKVINGEWRKAQGDQADLLSTERVRVRRAGNQHFVDVTISVPRSASFFFSSDAR